MVLNARWANDPDRLRAGALAWIVGGFALVCAASGAAAWAFGYGGVLLVTACTAFAVMSGIVLRALPAAHPHRVFGRANAVTLLRGGLLCVVLGALAEQVLPPSAPDVPPLVPALLGLVVVALDGLDGHLARRQRLASPFGARFDMEVDAFLMLLLSAWIAVEGLVGPWVVAIGALRYLFVAASWAVPRLAAPLAPSLRRKAVCVLQGTILCLLLTPLVPSWLASPLAAAALAALVWSFAADVRYLLDGETREERGLDGAALIGVLRSLVVYYARPWRRAALRRHYGSFVRPGMLAFDIGAHVGNRTRTLAALGARVVAVEPQPLFAALLPRLVPSTVDVIATAVGAAEGTATLRISSRHPTVSSLSADWIARVGGQPGFRQVTWDRTVEVPATTLDALIAHYGPPDFVKIDVEGLEAEILAGLSVPVPMLAFEALSEAPHVAEACVDRLTRLGAYEFNLVAGETHRWVWAAWGDAAAVRAELARWARRGCSGDVYARLSADDAAAAARPGASASDSAPGSAPASATKP